jgi:hypothetical protein
VQRWKFWKLATFLVLRSSYSPAGLVLDPRLLIFSPCC